MSKTKLLAELMIMLRTSVDDVSLDAIRVKFSDVLGNYDVGTRTTISKEKDIGDKADMFLAAKQLEGLSLETLKSYRIELNQLIKSMHKPVEQITTSDVRSYLMKYDYLKPSSLERKISVLRSFFGWLVTEEIILRNSVSKIKSPKVGHRLPKGLRIGELEAVREACTTLRERAIIELLYSTGCRLSELINMSVTDIDMQRMSAKVIGKGDKERVVYLSHKAVYHLKKYLDSRNDSCEALIITLRKSYRRAKQRAAQREVDKIESRSNIQNTLTPHVMRHTYATLSMESGIDLTDLQHLLGHSNPSTTLVYAQVSEDRKRMAYKKHHIQ